MNIYNRLIDIILKSYGYDINKSLNHLRYLKALSENLFWDEQSKKRDKIINHHISHTTWYRNFFDPDKKIEMLFFSGISIPQFFSNRCHFMLRGIQLADTNKRMRGK